MTPPAALFTVRDLHHRYGPRRAWVFAGFGHGFTPGLTLIRGPSGCGKSTLLKLLAGFLPPTAGSVTTWHGAPPDEGFQRRELGFVFQQFNLLPAATLRRNLELAGALAGVAAAPLAAAVDHWLGRLGLEPWQREPAETLSGGQLQRAALARALVKSPAVLLLDEPTSGLDDANAALIAGTVRDWCATGRSAVISTHDPRLADSGHAVLNLAHLLPVE